MIYFNYTNPKMLVAEEGKILREKNDVYKEKYTDENGMVIEEHFPYYTSTVFLPDNVTEEQAREMYIEEVEQERK